MNSPQENFNDDKPMLSDRARLLEYLRLCARLNAAVQKQREHLRRRRDEGNEWKGENYGQ